MLPTSLTKNRLSKVHKGTSIQLIVIILVAVALGGIVSVAQAGDDVAITIKDHRFEPAEITVPAGQKVTSVTNQDATPEEFDSDDLDIEKVIAGQQSATIQVGPLDAGRYEFHDEYHEDTAKGAIMVKSLFSSSSARSWRLASWLVSCLPRRAGSPAAAGGLASAC
jgi:plastocyanin